MKNSSTLLLTEEVDQPLHRYDFLIDIPGKDPWKFFLSFSEKKKNKNSSGIILSPEANDGEIRTGELVGTKRLPMEISVKNFSFPLDLPPRVPESIPVCGDPGLKRLPEVETPEVLL